MIAASDPARVPYLYYVDAPNTCGKLAFATTYGQFEADVAAYNARATADGGRAPPNAVSGSPPPLRPGRLGVLGWPVAHSRSPQMPPRRLRATRPRGLELPATAGAAELFAEIVRGLAAAGFVGANVTLPHKQAALALATAPAGSRARSGRRTR